MNSDERSDEGSLDAPASEIQSGPESPPAAVSHDAILDEAAHGSSKSAAEPEQASQAPRAKKAGFPWLATGALAAGLLALAGVAALYMAPPVVRDADLSAQVAAIASKQSAAQTDATALAALSKRVAALEELTAAMKSQTAAPRPQTAAPANADPGALAAQVASLSAALASTKADSDGLVRGLSDLSSKLSALAERVSALETARQAPQIDADALKATANGAADEARAAALVVISNALVDAVNTGAPFTNQIEAARSLGADPNAVKTLQPLAASGAPTAADLARQFQGLAGPILARTTTTAAGSSFLDALASKASSLVNIRSVGDDGGDQPAAVAARIEAALARGDVGGALAARDLLPDSGKQATAAWAARAAQRQAAQKAAQALADFAASHLAKAPS